MKRLLLVIVAATAMFGFTAGVMAQAQPAPPPPKIQVPPTRRAAPPETLTMKVNTLSANRFVVVRDMGSHQLVMVYEVDDKGKVSQSDKKKFFY